MVESNSAETPAVSPDHPGCVECRRRATRPHRSRIGPLSAAVPIPENRGVAGSIPALATRTKRLHIVAFPLKLDGQDIGLLCHGRAPEVLVGVLNPPHARRSQPQPASGAYRPLRVSARYVIELKRLSTMRNHGRLSSNLQTMIAALGGALIPMP